MFLIFPGSFPRCPHRDNDHPPLVPSDNGVHSYMRETNRTTPKTHYTFSEFLTIQCQFRHEHLEFVTTGAFRGDCEYILFGFTCLQSLFPHGVHSQQQTTADARYPQTGSALSWVAALRCIRPQNLVNVIERHGNSPLPTLLASLGPRLCAEISDFFAVCSGPP